VHLGDNVFLTELCDSVARRSSEAELDLDDIAGIMSYLGSRDFLCSVTFAANDFSRLPLYALKETNIFLTADQQQ